MSIWTHYLLGNGGSHLYNGNIFMCGTCKKIYKTQVGLQKHKCLLCTKCGNIFSSNNKLKNHSCKLSNDVYKCQNCRKLYKTQLNLENHKCSYCSKCNSIFSTHQKFKSHSMKCLGTTEEQINHITERKMTSIGILKEDALHSEKDDFFQGSSCMKDIHSISDLQVLSTEPPTEQVFRPLNLDLQRKLCCILSIDPLRVIELYPKITTGSNLCRPGRTHTTVGDGNCFFRAISFALTGSEEHHLRIRHFVCEHMKILGCKISPIIGENISVHEYLRTSRMQQSTTWASQTELFALAHLLKTDIYSYTKNGNIWSWSKYSGRFIDLHIEPSDRCIYLFHKNLVHFDVVLDIFSDTNQSKTKAGQSSNIETVKQNSLLHNYFSTQKQLQNIKHHNFKREMSNDTESDNRRKRDRERKRIRRLDTDYRQKENERKRLSFTHQLGEKLHKKEKRKCDLQRKQENEGKRLSATSRENEKLHKREKRKSDLQRDYENREKRLSARSRENEKLHKREKRKSAMQRKHENQEKRLSAKSRENEKLHKCEKRKSELQRKHENEEKRLSATSRENEKLHKREKRKSHLRRGRENEAKRISSTNRLKEKVHKREKRICEEFTSKEKSAKKYKKEGTVEILIQKFHEAVKDGPFFICTSCNQMWYRYSVRLATSLKISEDLQLKCLNSVNSVDEKEWICNTCSRYIAYQKLPPCSIYNGMQFPKIPKELELSEAEEKLVSLRIPFMQLKELPRGKQISLHGNVVNVPTNVSQTIAKLPRSYNEDATVPMKLKRKLSYKHHVDFQTIRPEKVTKAVEWLLLHSEQYQQAGIKLDTSWRFEETEEIEHEMPNSKQSDHKEEDWNEIPEEDLPCGTLDTLLQPQDLTTEAQEVFSFAPGEGNTPINIFFDKYSEEISFPTIFCGSVRQENSSREVKVSYSDICKSELRNADRRVAGHIPDIFFKFKKLQAKNILDKANICIRKTKKTQNLSAGFLKEPGNIEKLCRLDEGYRIFRDLRGSPPYWEQAKKDIFALIRQLGIPTWFTSFSAAETHWTHLLQILGWTVDKKKYSEEEVQQFTFFKKADLLRKDPVICARHFEHQVQTFINQVLKSSIDPIGKVTDFFYKVEFQMRGSPHIHMILWIDNAPKLGVSSEKDIVSFIDKYVTCAKNEEIENLVQFQNHAHGRTCRRKNRNECRFNFPQPPMLETCILSPLEENLSESEKKKHKDNWQRVRKNLDSMNKGNNMSLAEFLQEMKLSHEDYLNAIRSSLNTKTIFLKRNLSELRINNYNPILLRAWRANMDIQFIIDAYACVMYIVSYISKAQRGMSNLLYTACKEAREGNLDLRKQVKAIGDKFLSHVEVSAQEAVYYILQMPLRKSSRQVIFINTAPEEERVIMLKSSQNIENLPDDSTDVEESNHIQRYRQRPSNMNNVCLADFVSLYRAVDSKVDVEKNENQQKDTYERNDCNNGMNIVTGKTCTVKKRQKQAAIRCVGYNEKNDPENFYRECIFLYYPWRYEKKIIGQRETYYQRFIDLIDSSDILEKMQEYNHTWKDLDQALEELKNFSEEMLENQWDLIAPCTEAVEKADIDEGVKELSEYPNNDASLLGTLSDSSRNEPEILKNYMSDEEYSSLVRSLNKEQYIFYTHILQHMTSEKQPLYIFLSGGAGVGKTVVVKSIYQTLIRFYDKQPGSNPDDAKVLLAAPTGKAAFLINGNTIHNLFNIPANQGLSYKPLKSDKLNTLRCKFQNVRMIIVDEISMVGNRMLQYMHQRLQQITGSGQLFGGISLLAVGDLYQLKPVFDGWIFENLTFDYGPLASNLWKDNFKLFQLKQIMRQRESEEFASILNRIRECKHTSKDICTLKTRTIDKDETNRSYPLFLPHIFLQNKMVDGFNARIFELSQHQKYSHLAKDYIIGDVDSEIKEKVRRSIPDDTSKTMGLEKKLQLCIDLRCEISVNVDVDDGLANGAAGTLKHMSKFNKKSNGYNVLWISFDNENIGKKCRTDGKRLFKTEVDKSWTPITQVKRAFMVGRYKSVQVVREQFPLRAAAAKTSHRCQGDTLDAAVVDFTGRCFPHCHYVALSRVRNIDHLYIRELNEKKIHVDISVSKEMQRMEEEMKLETVFNALFEKKNSFRIYYQNVRSFRKHHDDVLHDIKLYHPDLIIFVESKLSNCDKDEHLEIAEYFMYRFDCINDDESRSPYGIIVFSKLHLDKNTVFEHQVKRNTKEFIESVTMNIKLPQLFPLEFMKILGIYSSPSTTFHTLQQFLLDKERDQYPSDIIVGDFNVDIFPKTNHQIFKTMKNFEQVVSKPTTINNTLIDHVYIRRELNHRITCDVLFTYFSDHHPLLLTLSSRTD